LEGVLATDRAIYGLLQSQPFLTLPLNKGELEGVLKTDEPMTDFYNRRKEKALRRRLRNDMPSAELRL
jgi:hypothetical protein